MYEFTDKSIAPAYRVLDTGVAIVSLVLGLILLNLPHDAQHLGSFLETRITLKNALLLCGLTLAWPSMFAAFGLYRLEELNTFTTELSRVAKACTLGSAFAIVVALTSMSGAFGALSVLVFLLTVTIGTLCARAVGRRLLRAVARHQARPPRHHRRHRTGSGAALPTDSGADFIQRARVRGHDGGCAAARRVRSTVSGNDR